MKREPAILLGISIALWVAYIPIATAQAPSPPPELKLLETYVGTWEFEWDLKPTIFFPSEGKVRGIERYEWLPGGHFLQMIREAQAPEGDYTEVITFGYDQLAKNFYAQMYSSTHGWSASATITVNGNVRLWTASGRNTDGTPFQERCTRTLAAGGASLTISCEATTDGRTWFPEFEGKHTKLR